MKLLDDSIGDFSITFFRPHIFLDRISKTTDNKGKKRKKEIQNRVTSN